MATDTTVIADSATSEATDNAYITPTVDFLLVLLCTITLAFAAAAVIFP